MNSTLLRSPRLNKKILVNMLLGGLFIFLSTPLLQAQGITEKRVQFERGRSGATIESSITGDQIIDYLLNVQQGQFMNVSMASSNGANYFNIMEPNEANVAIFNGSNGENMFEGTLDKSGDYRIRVYLMRSAARRNEKANYRLEINVSAFEKSSSTDALVPGTDYNATGYVTCQMGKNKPTGDCAFGVKREGNGGGMVTVTKPDGRTRTIFFENGKATGYDMSQADKGEFSSSKNADVFIIYIGEERYEIPEGVVFGG